MKLAMIDRGGRAAPAAVLSAGAGNAAARTGGAFLDLGAAGLPWVDLEGIAEGGEEAMARVREAAEAAPAGAAASGAVLLCPLTRPEKILCIGKNYADHCREFGSPLPAKPVLFAKYRNALSGPGGLVELPSVSRKVDYEAELAVVMGRTCKNVDAGEALAHVFGYTCANDLTMRDAQAEDGQWTRAKSPDGFCPLGPWIVTADEIGNPQDLGIRLALNGEAMQDSRTSEMVFGVAELVSFLSQAMTLRPGDVILTGTPAGVGMGRKPPVYLKRGDTVAVEIERIGSLKTLIR